jgi:hypothetical protein
MARVALITLLVACRSGVSSDHELCARAAARFAECEELAGEKLDRELAVDRWRGLCRAVFTGETKQLLPDALSLFQAMNEDVKAALRTQAECSARATTCAEHAACE